MGSLVLTAIAAFAEAFVNPVAPLLVLGAALLVANPWLVRAWAAVIGGLMPLASRLGEDGTELALAMLGAAAAALLHAEIALHLIVPVLRWTGRCLVTAWELGWLMLAMLHTLWRSLRRQPPAPPGKDGSR